MSTVNIYKSPLPYQGCERTRVKKCHHVYATWCSISCNHMKEQGPYCPIHVIHIISHSKGTKRKIYHILHSLFVRLLSHIQSQVSQSNSQYITENNFIKFQLLVFPSYLFITRMMNLIIMLIHTHKHYESSQRTLKIGIPHSIPKILSQW